MGNLIEGLLSAYRDGGVREFVSLWQNAERSQEKFLKRMVAEIRKAKLAVQMELLEAARAASSAGEKLVGLDVAEAVVRGAKRNWRSYWLGLSFLLASSRARKVFWDTFLASKTTAAEKKDLFVEHAPKELGLERALNLLEQAKQEAERRGKDTRWIDEAEKEILHRSAASFRELVEYFSGALWGHRNAVASDVAEEVLVGKQKDLSDRSVRSLVDAMLAGVYLLRAWVWKVCEEEETFEDFLQRMGRMHALYEAKIREVERKLEKAREEANGLRGELRHLEEKLGLSEKEKEQLMDKVFELENALEFERKDAERQALEVLGNFKAEMRRHLKALFQEVENGVLEKEASTGLEKWLVRRLKEIADELKKAELLGG